MSEEKNRLSQRRAKLTPAKQALLAKRLRGKRVDSLASKSAHTSVAGSEYTPLPVKDNYTPTDFPLTRLDQQTLDKLLNGYGKVEDIYPLSPMQQALLLHQFSGKSDGGFLQAGFTIKGDLNVAAFKQAWQHLLDRYSILRTTFVWENLRELLQIVHREVFIPWIEQDWRDLSTAEQQEKLMVFRQADREQGFNLSQVPLTRLSLIHLAEDTYEFIWSHHHLQIDGFSMSILQKEVFRLYAAFNQNQQLKMKPSIPYRDYIAWLQRQDLSQAKNVWQKALKDFKQPTPLPTGPDPFPRVTKEYDREQIALSASTTSALQSLAQQHRLTLNALLQGGWALLLSRYSGKDDVLFGATVTGRTVPMTGIESMVGLFINNVPVRVQSSTEDTLLPWLIKFQRQRVMLQEYEHSPLTQIQQWSDIPAHTRMYETLFVFQNYITDSAKQNKSTGLTVYDSGGTITSNYPLTILAIPGPELLLKVVYECYRFTPTIITRILEHFKLVLEGMATVPTQSIQNLQQQIDDLPQPQPNQTIDQTGALTEPIKPPTQNTYVAPQDPLELQLTKIWEAALDVEPIGVTDNYFELGGHSLLAVYLFQKIEQEIGKSLPLTTLLYAQTIEQQAAILREKKEATYWSSLVPIQPNGSALPLFCVHAGGATVLFYRDLANRLGPDQPLYAFQPQGLDGKQPRHTRVEDMAAHYIKEMRTLQPEGPYFLGGASFGGLVAFEMGHQLRTQGQQVAMIALLDTFGPGYPKPLPGIGFFQKKIYTFIQRFEHHWGGIILLEREKRLAYIQEKAGKARHQTWKMIMRIVRDVAKRLYAEMNRPLPQNLQETQNAIAIAAKSYKPQVYPGRVILFRASKQPPGIYPDPTSGWEGLAADGLEIHKVPGHHGALAMEPRVRFLVEKLQPCLETARTQYLDSGNYSKEKTSILT